MLHKLLVVDSAVPIDVSKQVQGQGLFFSQLQIYKLLKALLVLVPLQEAIAVDVESSECCKNRAVFVNW